ncbi:helix-turn-helix transcriptional regulator [Candidatus Bathyarchaeota archaeon]|nr:helix-turn-helix transcriptional regulator [Candidatus Bathyarchaeota archaeon]
METIDSTLVKCITDGKGTLKLLSSRGTMEILCTFCCSQKRVRFNELNKLFKHVSTKTLTSRLRELEKEKILTRTSYNEIPPRVEYSMTQKGQSLVEAILPLIQWIANEKQ